MAKQAQDKFSVEVFSDAVLSPKSAHIGWDRFLSLLDFQERNRDKLSVEQLEALAYMRNYSTFNRRISNRVPKMMLEFYIMVFMSFETCGGKK